MPAFPRTGTAFVLAAALASTAAVAAVPAPASKVHNSALDAPLFYQLLVGELELREGEPGTAYQVYLDAARRTRDEQLFRRATDIALQARAGEQALAAVKAWRTALPASLDALRYEVQLLIALNRIAELPEPLAALLQMTPGAQRAPTIESLPRLFVRATDKPAAAKILTRTLQPWVAAQATEVAARVAIGRMWLLAGDGAGALEQAQRAHAADATAEAPAVLALELLPTTPAAEDIVADQLMAKPDSTEVRIAYVRTLASVQRYGDAAGQLEILTKTEPKLAPPWLTLGALRVEMRQPAAAITALETYIGLVESGSDADAAEARANPEAAANALTEARLLLAQAAEQKGDYAGAESWLGRVDDPKRALDVQSRRASLLARQGHLAEARELIRRVPEQTAADARAKVMAETQLLRQQRQWADAEQLLADANRRFADDPDLLYEQAMMDEKLDRLGDMERLLRRVIEIRPESQQAYNALGYSLADRNMRLPEARSVIQKALELSPGEPCNTDRLGWVEYRLGNVDESLRLLRQAYQARPDPEIAAHLGEVLWHAGQKDEALRVWREGHARDGTNEVLRETLTRLQVEL
jgi:tetratricopeptide (TPR) repeat protein